MQQGQSSLGRTLIWAVIVIIAAILVYFLLGQKSEAPAESTTDGIGQEDTTAAIQGQLDSINTDSLDADLKNIDDQLNSL